MVPTGGQAHLSSVSRTALHHSRQEVTACGLPEPPRPQLESPWHLGDRVGDEMSLANTVVYYLYT